MASVRRACGTAAFLVLGLCLLLTLGVVGVYELTSFVDTAEGSVTGELLNPESVSPARGLTPMLERYDDPQLPPLAFAALESGVRAPAGAPPPSTAVQLFGAWRERTEMTLLGSRFDDDWDETPPLPSVAAETPALERSGLSVDRTRLGRLRSALDLLYRALRDEGKVELAARLLLARLSLERQVLVHEATSGPGILPATRRLFVRALDLAAMNLSDLGRGGALPPALLGTALTRLATLDACLPLADRVLRGLPLLVGQVAARHPSVFLDAGALDEGLRARLGPVGALEGPLRGRFARLQGLAAAPPPPRGTLWERLLSPRQAVTRAVLAAAAADLEFATAARDEAQAQARLRGTALLWAASAVRGRTGRWPTDVAELRPAVGERMSRDPFTGDLLRWRVDGDILFIWTPGLDGNTAAPIPVPGCVVLVPPPSLVLRRARP